MNIWERLTVLVLAAVVVAVLEGGELVLQRPSPPGWPAGPAGPAHAPGHHPVAAGRQQLVEGLAKVVGEERVEDGVHAAVKKGTKAIRRGFPHIAWEKN